MEIGKDGTFLVSKKRLSVDSPTTSKFTWGSNSIRIDNGVEIVTEAFGTAPSGFKAIGEATFNFPGTGKETLKLVEIDVKGYKAIFPVRNGRNWKIPVTCLPCDGLKLDSASKLIQFNGLRDATRFELLSMYFGCPVVRSESGSLETFYPSGGVFKKLKIVSAFGLDSSRFMSDQNEFNLDEPIVMENSEGVQFERKAVGLITSVKFYEKIYSSNSR